MNKKKKLPVHRDSSQHLPIVQKKADCGIKRVNEMINSLPSPTDPNGSYTGNPLDENEVPVQDADDL